MQRRNFIALCGTVALAGALPGGRARAAEGDIMGQLQPHLLLGEEGSWQGSIDQGRYRLVNATAFNNVQFITAGAPEGVQRVVVDVAPFGTGAYCGAGLLVNRVGAEGGWMAVALQPTGSLGIYVNSPQRGLERVTELPAQGLDPNFMTRLSLENASGGIDILTNGQKCGSFSDIKLKGACGIVAFDIGQFYFANFWMN
jgi:hypothetical protein